MVRKRVPGLCCQVTKGIDTVRSGQWCRQTEHIRNKSSLPVLHSGHKKTDILGQVPVNHRSTNASPLWTQNITQLAFKKSQRHLS